MSRNAVEACAAETVPLIRLERPGWATAPGAHDWHWVDSHEEAASLPAQLGRRPFLTIGRQSLGRFTGPLASAHVLARVGDEPDKIGSAACRGRGWQAGSVSVVAG